MSYAANPNKANAAKPETPTASAARQQRVERERIRRLIITLGDDNKKVLGQIRGLVGALEDDVELHGELMMRTAVECAQHLPLKTTIMAAWVARMAEKHANWGASVIAAAFEELKGAVLSGHMVPSQLLLRFFVCLGNAGLVALSGVAALLQEVLAVSDGLRPTKGGDLGVYLTLSSLPFLSPAAHAKIVDNVDGLIAGAGTYLAARDAQWKPLLRLLKSEEPMDRLEALAMALGSLKAASWSAQSIFHLPGFEPSVEVTEGKPKLPPFGVTAADLRKNKVRLQIPLTACRLITSKMQDGPDEQMREYDRWFLEDYILLTMESFARDVEACSKQLLMFPFLHQQFEAVIVETIFSQMLRLPSPPLLPLFYQRLLQACVEKQKSMGKLIEHTYAVLIERLHDLDEECMESLAEAFAYHLVHNGYQTDWAPFTGDQVAVQTQRFMRRTLERLLRLSFHQNLVHRLPEAVRSYIPQEPSPAKSLPIQGKPEFTRMLGLARIKDPDEKLVLRYCQRLLKVQWKEEQKDEEEVGGGAGTVAAAVTTDTKAADETKDVRPAVGPGEVAEMGATRLDHRKEDPKDGGEGGRDGGDSTAAAKDDGYGVVAATGEPTAVAVSNEDQSTQLASAHTTEEDEVEYGGPEDEEDGKTGLSTDVHVDGDDGGADDDAPPVRPPKRRRVGNESSRVKEEVKDELGEGSAGLATAKVSGEGVSGCVADEIAKREEEDFGEPPTEPWALDAVAELLVVAVLQNGSKTPTHMSRMLDGHQQVFAKLCPSDEDMAHVFTKALVRGVFQFWQLSGQRLEITLDSMLHRDIITSRAIVEQALGERAHHACDRLPVWNLINSVARKSLERSQAVRVELGIAKRLGKAEVVEKCKSQLDVAIHETAELFTFIFTDLVRSHQDFEDKDLLLRTITLQRVLMIGRKYHAFIKPLVDAAESRIPGVAHNPEIAAVFQSLRAL